MEGRLYPDPRLRQRHSRKVQGKDLGGTHRGAADPHARLDDLDTDGIDVQVVYGSLGLALTTIRDTDFAVAIARALNDYYAEFCDTAPTRLAAMAALPAQDLPAAVEELRRAVVELGHLGGTVPPSVAGQGARRPGPRPAVRRGGPPRRADLGALGQRLASAGGGHRALRHPLHGPRHRPSLRADDRDGGDRVRRRARRPSGAAGRVPRGGVRLGAVLGRAAGGALRAPLGGDAPHVAVAATSTCPTGAASSPPSPTNDSCPKRSRRSARRR